MKLNIKSLLKPYLIMAFALTVNLYGGEVAPTCDAGYTYKDMGNHHSYDGLIVDTNIGIPAGYSVNLKKVWTHDTHTSSSPTQPHEVYKAQLTEGVSTAYTTDIPDTPYDEVINIYTDLATIRNSATSTTNLTFRHWGADNDNSEGNSVTLGGFCYKVVPPSCPANYTLLDLDIYTSGRSSDTGLVQDITIDSLPSNIQSIDFKDVWTTDLHHTKQDYERFRIEAYDTTTDQNIAVTDYTTDVNNALLDLNTYTDLGTLNLSNASNIGFRARHWSGDAAHGDVTDPNSVTMRGLCYKIMSNRPPVANPDGASTTKNTPITIDIIGNDTDPDGDDLTVTNVGTPTNGTIVDNGDGTVTYTPNTDFEGTDTFEYTISDGNGGTSTATVTIEVPVDGVPAAAYDRFALDEDTTKTDTLASNDTPSSDGGNVWTKITDPANGTVTVNTDGTFTYTPNQDFNGQDSFTYKITDADGDVSEATVILDVTPVNDAPKAVDDVKTTPEDTAVDVPVLINDTDVDGDTLTVKPGTITTPANGTVALNADGTIKYKPNTNFHGTDTFEYTVQDGNGGEDTATVTVTITPVNDAPVAKDDSNVTQEDTPVDIAVLDNDSDVDGDTLSVIPTSITDPANGTATLNADGTIKYTPNANYHGTDTFNYTISDGHGGTDTATVTVTITSVNDDPVAVDDTETTQQNIAVNVPVLLNDSDVDGDTISVDTVTQPANGTVSDNGDGTVKYTPNLNYNGTDTFTYTITDGHGGTDTATVTVIIGGVNLKPEATNDAKTTPEDTAVNIDVVANDDDPDNGPNTPLVVVSDSISTPANGTATLNADGTIKYTPNANYHGTDIFTYVVSDGELTDTATVTVTITPENDAPVAVDDTKSTPEDTAVDVPVLINDSDVDGDTLTVKPGTITTPTSGTATLNADGTIKYTPNLNFHGTDTFEYTVQDGNGGEDTATVTVTIDPENDAPVAVDDSNVTQEDTPVDIAVLDNDSDVDGDTLSVIPTSITDPANGTATLNADGTIKYAPDANYHGIDTFEYTITDGDLNDTATVTISIGDVEKAPVAVDDNETTDEDTHVEIIVLTNDSDPDNDSFTTTSATAPSHGSVSINAGGTITYTPDADYNGIDTFTYIITDSTGLQSDPATVTVTINPVNDAPVAVNDTNVTEVNTPIDVHVLVNDSDVDGDTLSVVEASMIPPAHGSVTVNADNTITYTPNADYVGLDKFRYTITDGDLTAETNVTIGIMPPNKPDAVDDNYTTPIDTEKNLSVLTNDTDPDGDDLNITSFTQPANGTVTNNGDGTLKYVPDTGFTGTDTFEYTISDGNGGEDTAMVTVVVSDVKLPDYRPKFTTHGLFVNGAEGDVDILLTIAEGLNGVNTGDLRFVIRKNANLELNFDPNKTMQQNRVVQNAFWELSETSGLYIFKYVGNGGAFPPADVSLLGFDAHFISPPASKGKFNLRVQILDGSGGDTNKDNNKDTDTIRYNNL